MKKLLIIVLLLAAVVHAEDLGEVTECRGYCNPMQNPSIDSEHVEWLNSDEWGWKEEYQYEHSYEPECSSVSLCEAFCWFEYDYPPHPQTEGERLQAIENYKSMSEEFVALPDSYCNGEELNKWNGITSAQGYIGKYSNELGAYVAAAEAYYRQGRYYEDMHSAGFEKATYADALPLAANSYRESGKAYCKMGMDGEAHAQFESARRVYRSLGDMDEEWIAGLVDSEECGRYAEETDCSSAFILAGAVALSFFVRKEQ